MGKRRSNDRRKDRLLDLLVGPMPTIEEGERELEEAIASGRLAEAQLDAAFARFWGSLGGKTIGSVLADWMKAQHLTTRSLARNWGCPESTIESLLARAEPVSTRNHASVVWRVARTAGVPLVKLSGAISEGLHLGEFSSSREPLHKAARRRPSHEGGEDRSGPGRR